MFEEVSDSFCCNVQFSTLIYSIGYVIESYINIR